MHYDAFTFLSDSISLDQRDPMPFVEYFRLAKADPLRLFRNIFQLFPDMIESFLGQGIQEYPDDPENVNYLRYEPKRLFEESDKPFFADRLFLNNLAAKVRAFKAGRQNRILVFEGPPGSGKSTAMYNLLARFEEYGNSRFGQCYDTLWRLPLDRFPEMRECVRGEGDLGAGQKHREDDREFKNLLSGKYLDIVCPSHDHPILQIPRHIRREFLNKLLADVEGGEKILKILVADKQYEWIWKNQPCTICESLFRKLSSRPDDFDNVYELIWAVPRHFNRRVGQGVSVFNPGDAPSRQAVLTNEPAQRILNMLFKDSRSVRILFSRYAATNDGIYVIMDVKDHNEKRFKALHGLCSEAVHKLDDEVEETVSSLFVAVMNPEDKENGIMIESLNDRITTIQIPYILDYSTEARQYLRSFGDDIARLLLPRVLDHFAMIVVSTRLKDHSAGIEEWLGNQAGKYKEICDCNFKLLKMALYKGLIPSYLQDEHRDALTAARRRKILDEAEQEGQVGFSGRDALDVFHDFYFTLRKKKEEEGGLITIRDVLKFFKKLNHGKNIPPDFLGAIRNHYAYHIYKEVEECLTRDNPEQVDNDVMEYVFSTNYDNGQQAFCPFTRRTIQITTAGFVRFEVRILGTAPIDDRLKLRQETQRKYAQFMSLHGHDSQELAKVDFFQRIREMYERSLKEKIMEPFVDNSTFRSALGDWASPAFEAYDQGTKDDIALLISNMRNRFGYTDKGAQKIVLWVLDENLAYLFK